eukprot:1150757-Pelagomonas_calceolata.AAC.1
MDGRVGRLYVALGGGCGFWGVGSGHVQAAVCCTWWWVRLMDETGRTDIVEGLLSVGACEDG